MRLSKIVLSLIISILAITIVAAQVPSPGDTVKTLVEAVRLTVKESQDKIPEEELDKKLRAIILPVFDFQDMSRRSLGAQWKTVTDAEREEFSSLFSELLAKTYLKRIRNNAAKSVFNIIGETTQGESSLVRTEVEYDGEKIAIDYRMQLRDGKWHIYDVIVENIGLVSNYRSEFGGIIKKDGFGELLAKLRSK